MLTLDDCIALCGLTEDEVMAIAEHERIPEIAAAEMANYLVSRPDGEQFIKSIIKDDMASASARDDRQHLLALKLVIRNFIAGHPRCEERHRNELCAVERRAG